MKIIIDTNIALDVLLNRQEFIHPSYDVLKSAVQGQVTGYITTNAVTDIYYVLHKNCHDAVKAKEAIEQLLKLVNLADVISIDISAALTSNVSDFEDAVVACVAKRVKADFIVTRNIKDFINSAVPSILPGDFLKKIARINGSILDSL